MIQTQSTGAPKAFADKLQLSERSLYNYLRFMKKLGAPIAYSRTSQTYLYAIEGRILLEFKELSDAGYAIR